jgi:RimJ/RimL family protein N-acetyltransferase
MIINDFQLDGYEFINYINLTEQLQKQVYTIRILENVRIKMVNTEIFSYESHLAFVDSLINNDNKIYWAIYKNSVFYSSINFHPLAWTEKWAEWGIFINPLFEGKGMARKISCLFLDHIAKHTPLKQIKAKIKICNSKSIHFHHRVGFNDIGEDNLYLHLVYKLK